MDHLKQKLKNRLNLKFDPNKNHPSHRYSLKKISLEKSYKDNSQNQQQIQSQSILLSSSRNKSLSAIKLPSLEKVSNNLINKDNSPLKKGQRHIDSSMLNVRQKLRVSSIKLNKIQGIDKLMDSSVTSNAVGNLSKFNYGIEPIHFKKDVGQKRQRQDHSIIERKRQTEKLIFKYKNFQEDEQNSVNASIISSAVTHRPKIIKNVINGTPENKQKKEKQAKVKVENKSSIHQTLTFLIKNQILTVPKIVALLKKSHSQEFLYMKMRGIYQFQVCDENDKGKDFVTVSRNGMVIDGQIISLEKMVHEFEMFQKLRKIPFFKNFVWSKFMTIWGKGSKKAQFIQNRGNINKLLNLEQKKFFKKIMEVKNCLFIEEQNLGSINEDWIDNTIESIRSKRKRVVNQLLKLCHEMLSKYDLPLSQSGDMLTKALDQFNGMSIGFQVRIRIQKEMETFYRVSRSLQFQFFFRIGWFIFRHIETLTQKIFQSTRQYQHSILKPMEMLDIENDSYSLLKEQVLMNSPLTQQVQFIMNFDQNTQSFTIFPSAENILHDIMSSMQMFFEKMQRESLKLVRINEFSFLDKILKKFHGSVRMLSEQKPHTIKSYISSFPQYNALFSKLEQQIIEMSKIFVKREKLDEPFLQVYKEFKEKNNITYTQQCFYSSFQKDLKQIARKKEFCNKIHDGEYFILGYLDLSNMKNTIINQINKYEQKIFNYIPQINKKEKTSLVNDISNYLRRIQVPITSPELYIEILQLTQEIQLQLIQYSSKILELQKISILYYKNTKKELSSLTYEKNLLSQLRLKIKSFKQKRQTIYFQYRRLLETQRKNLIDKVQKISLKSEQLYNVSSQPWLVHKKIKESINFLTHMNTQIKHFNELQIFFGLKQTRIPKLQVLLVEYESLQDIWNIYQEWEDSFQSNIDRSIFDIEAEKQLFKFETNLRKLQKYVKNIEYFELCKFLQTKVLQYVESMQFISQVQFKSLREEDFFLMNKSLQSQLSRFSSNSSKQGLNELWKSMDLNEENKSVVLEKINVKKLTLRKIIQLKLYQFKNIVQQITFKCRKQLQIKETIEGFLIWWKNLKLSYKSLDDYPLVYIFDTNDNIRREIDEYSTILVNILNHKHGAFIRKQCTTYLKNMNNLTELLRLTIEHQQKFLTLYPILTSSYAEKHLLPQFKKFQSILQKTMRNLRWIIKPTESLNQQTRTLLLNHIKHFDSILKYLADFLQRKRIKFQRFYFLQDTQMLELLVGNQNESHVFRMFEGIRGWLQDKQQIKIGVIGVGGEHLKLKGWVYKNNQPQTLFRSLEQAIKGNLNSIVRKILHSYESQMKELKDLYKNLPWMCVYTVELILFTKQIQMNCFYEQISFEMQKSLIRQNILAASSSPIDNSNYITLMLFLLHFTGQLQKQNVTNVFHFQWFSFLKFYHQHNNVVMRCLGQEHSWGGEYQGLWNLMVNTSDIRRVHTSVLTNLKFANGVLLQGPSGTGKTQSLKELARCMAKYCVVFNCSGEVSIQTLQKLLSGLCYTSSWICLDEINRLSPQIMSVIANQINTIKNALNSGKSNFNFMGKKIQLKHGVGIFSTMNPIYLQRANLTENLKSYFRIISVSSPDYETILQVMLYSLKFLHASENAKKISRLLKNLSIQLSKHLQYDFGMRTIKVFIKILSKIKKQHRKEQEAIYFAFYETFYSRLNPFDQFTFHRVMKDVLEFSPQNLLYRNEKFHSIATSVQTGTIIVGPTSCKSSLISQFISSIKDKKIKIDILNTSSLQQKYLMGQNLLGRWNPGFLQRVAKRSIQNQNEMNILVLDSKLKSEMIENFNTLLDQSKLLTLPNGTRIKVRDNFKLIMQTPDLSMTSPATITRCHVIYVDLKDVSKQQIIESILPNLEIQKLQRFSSILKQLQIEQIIKVGQIYPIFWNIEVPIKYDRLGRKIFDKTTILHLTQNQTKGLQKVIFYTIHILDLTKKVKDFLSKQNMIPLKKSAHNFVINFQKYSQGQFIEIVCGQNIEKTLSSYWIPTISSQFCKYVTKESIKKRRGIIWYGKSLVGKTETVRRSIKQLMQLENFFEKKLITIAIDKFMDSKQVTQLIEDRISTKNLQVSEDVLIMVEDVNMCNQQSGQLLRYLSEYQCMLSNKSRDLIKFQKLTTHFQFNNQNGNKNSRLTRHFAELSFPQLNDNDISNLYSKLIRINIAETKTTSFFKQNLSIQIEKISVFLSDYIKKKKKMYDFVSEGHINELKTLKIASQFSIISCLNNLRIINEKFVKDPSDFVEFLLIQLRKQEIELNQNSQENRIKILDLLKLSFIQSFKQKYQEAYNNSLKSIESLPKQISFYTGTLTGNIQKTDWTKFKTEIHKKMSQKFYISEFMIAEIIYIMRTLEYQGGNYILVGKEGFGKKVLFKIAGQLCNSKFVSLDNIQRTRIKQAYFSILKEAFLKDKKIILCIDAASKNYHQWLLFLERLRSGFPMKFLFKSDEIEEAYSITEGSPDYQGVNKSYDEVVRDFFLIADENIHIFISCRIQNASQTIQNYNCIAKNSTIRYAYEFPLESIAQISETILENDILQKQNAKRLSSVFLKLYQDLNFLVQQNQKVRGFSYFKHNSISHFKLLQNYVENQKDIIQFIKRKQDQLNRAISKVEETYNIHQQLKSQIQKIRQKILISQEILTSFLPELQEKKAKFNHLNEDFHFDKKQISGKRKEIEEIEKQIQVKRKSIEPFLKDAVDSIFSIKRADLNEIKTFAVMHPLLRFSVQNLIILLGEQETEENIKKVLGDHNILIRMKHCHSKVQDCAKVRTRIQTNQDWTFESLSKVAFHYRYLQKWTVNILKVSEMRNELNEIIKLYQKLRLKLTEMQTLAEEKYSLVIHAETQLHEIEQKYVQKKNSLASLQQKLTTYTRKVTSVQNIKSSLETYKQSWIDESKKGNQVLKNLQYIASVYTYFMKIHPYLKQHDKKQVQMKLEDHLKKAMFAMDFHFNPIDFLKQKLLFESLNQQQSNETSLKNKYETIFSHKNDSYQDTNNLNIIFLKFYFNKRPIIFDPDNQALKWLNQKLQNSSDSKGLKMIITRSSFNSAKKSVELAIREGYLLVLIVEDQFDEFTSEILNSKITQSMNRRLIEYNKNLLYVQQNFEVILCNKSRKPNPSLTYFNEHQVINFQVTKEFLNIQLLNELLISESQTNFHLKKSLQIEKKTNSQEKSRIQKNIIDLLINLKKQIFDDEKLIQTIHQGAKKVQILENNLNQLSEKMGAIYGQINLFEDLCHKVCEIYFSLKIMSQVSQFFNWNVEIFIKYFIQACLQSISQSLFNQTDEKDDNFSFGNQMQQALLNYEFENYIGNGNSRANSALSYVSHVTSRIILQDRRNDFEEDVKINIRDKIKEQVNFDVVISKQQVFIDETKKGVINKERQRKILQRLLCNLKHPFNENQKVSWALILSVIQSPESEIKLLFNQAKLREKIEDYIVGQQITKNMKEVFIKLQPNAKVFANQVIIHPTPFTKYSQYFSPLQILVLCKLLKPSRFYELCIQLIEIKGYSKILQYKKTDVSDWLAGSDCVHPILLMMGEDPLSELTQYFARKNYKHVTLIAMGQGQAKIAQIVLQKESRKQNIVIIHNLHICPDFYEFLSKTLQQFQSRKPHKNFRLILITSLKNHIDPQIAGTCDKFLISQPNDLKNQMKNLYQKIPLQLTEKNHHKIMFSICFFHSMLNQLGRYKNFGWNSPYQFTQSDFINAIKIVNLIVESPLSLRNYQCNIEKQELKDTISDEIDFEGLKYLIGEMSYVGKLVNEIDRKKMRIYVNSFINSQILKDDFRFFKKYPFPKKFKPSQILNFVNRIAENNCNISGLPQYLKPSNQQITEILNHLSQCFTLSKNQQSQQNSQMKLQFLDKIDHNFKFINLEIQNFNRNLVEYLNKQNKSNNSVLNQTIKKNYQLLKEINQSTKVFDLRAFGNPSQFFVQIQKQAAIRVQTQYQKIQLLWTIHPKQNIPCYGVKNLTLEGGSIIRKQNAFYLETGKQQKDILLYVFGVQKKKRNQTHSNRKLVKIPLYLNHQRQGQINSYGDNTNLLTMVCIESTEGQQSWVLRSTAFIVG